MLFSLQASAYIAVVIGTTATFLVVTVRSVVNVELASVINVFHVNFVAVEDILSRFD